MSNDGSEAHPWGSLSAIVAAGLLPPAASAVVKSGDTVYLLSGNHGSFTLDGGVNSDFISIAATPDQSPVLTSITMNGGAYWRFSGLTIQNVATGAWGADITVDNLIFTGNTILSQADVSSWSQTDWQNNAISAIATQGTCVAITNNDIHNVRGGIGVGGSRVLVHGNKIDHIGDDGIDFGQGPGPGTIGDIEISNNTITNSLDIGDNNHNDGIQGWVLNGTTGTNILIDSNIVIGRTDPALPWTATMQGISEFDGAWDGIQMTNNVVVAGVYHGMALYGAHNATIINNTVFGTWDPGNGDLNDTWIGVFNGKDGGSPVNVVVRNNISGFYNLSTTGVTVDHNITATDPASLFTKFDRALFQYDFHPTPGSEEIGYGSTSLAPTHDITGAARGSSITAGAYQ